MVLPQKKIAEKVWAEGTAPTMSTKDFRKGLEKRKAGKDINEQNEDGETLLMRAAFSDNPEYARILIEEYGADLNITNDIGETALMYNALGGNAEITQLLLKKGAKTLPTSKCGLTASEIALTRNNFFVADLIFTKSKTEKGYIPELLTVGLLGLGVAAFFNPLSGIIYGLGIGIPMVGAGISGLWSVGRSIIQADMDSKLISKQGDNLILAANDGNQETVTNIIKNIRASFWRKNKKVRMLMLFKAIALTAYIDALNNADPDMAKTIFKGMKGLGFYIPPPIKRVFKSLSEKVEKAEKAKPSTRETPKGKSKEVSTLASVVETPEEELAKKDDLKQQTQQTQQKL